jgi:hypothetical protein
MSSDALSDERLAAKEDARFRSNLRSVIFCVEATSYERLALWRESAIDADDPKIHRPVRWRQMNPGRLITLGTLADMPVTLEITFALIENCSVLFYDSPSVVTDARMAEKWLDENVKPPKWGGDREARCDAMNFHQCLQAVEEFMTRCMDLVEAESNRTPTLRH